MVKINKKLNLQRHSLFGPDGPPSDVDNPILSEQNEGESTEQTEQKPIEQNEPKPVEQTEPKPTEQDEPKPTENKEDIKNYLNDFLEEIRNTVKPHEPSVEEKPKELTEEEIEQMNNDFYLKFTEKPYDTLMELINKKAEEKIQPIKQQYEYDMQVKEWNKRIQEFEKANPDFNEYRNKVAEILSSDMAIANSKNPIETAYNLAKLPKLQEEISKKNATPEELLKDEKNLDKLLSNKEIKDAILKKLMDSRPETPPVIGGEGSTIVKENQRPKSLREATEAWLKSMKN